MTALTAAEVDEIRLRRAAHAAAKIRRRLSVHTHTPQAMRRPRKVAVSLPPEVWEALLRETGR
jgi:hypothetical protein